MVLGDVVLLEEGVDLGDGLRVREVPDARDEADDVRGCVPILHRVPVLGDESPHGRPLAAVRRRSGEQVRRVLRPDLVRHRGGEDALDLRVAGEARRREQVALLLLRRSGRSVALPVAVEVVLRPLRRDGLHGRLQELRITFVLELELPALREGLGIGAEDREGLHELAAERAGQVGLVGRGIPAETREHRPEEVPDERPQALARLVVHEPVEPAEPAEDPLPHAQVGLVAEARDEVEERSGRGRSAHDRGPGVVDQAVALDRGQHVHRARDDPGPELVVVEHADEARRAGVRHDDGVGREQVELRAVGLDQDPVDALLVAGHLADRQRHRPRRGVVGVRRDVAALREPHAVAVEADGDRRVARLEDPGVHHAADGLARLLLERVPEIVRLGVPVGVLPEVPADPVAEALRAEPLLEHPQHRAALHVREGVEHPAGVVRRPDLVLDRPRRLQRVDLERVRPVARERVPDLPGRPEVVDREHRHERGERLVQPDPVPPAHRHEVAEPHVRQLVRDGLGDAELLLLRRPGRVEQQHLLAVGHAADVLHRPLREVRDRDVVELGLRVRDAVVVPEPVQGVDARVEREARQRALAGHVDDPHRHAACVGGLRDLERPDHPRRQVGRHLHRVAEPDPHPAVVERLPFHLRAVRDGGEPLLHDERGREDGLQVGLVPAGERAAGVRRLEVRGPDDAGGAVRVLIRAPVEAREPGIQLAGERDPEGPVPRLRGLGEREGRSLGVVVGEDLRDLDRAAVGGGERGAVELQLVRVQDDLGDRLEDLERDLDRAVERPGVEIRLQREVVARRDDRPREPVSLFGLSHQSFT